MAKRASNNNRAVFLDRDGVIIEEKNYLHRPERVELLPGAARAIVAMSKRGFKIIVVTNQSGVARGYFTDEDVSKVHERLESLLEREGARIDAFYYCPHLDNCDCRKPKTGMVDRAVADFDIDASASYVIGDKASDMELARNVGAKAVLTLTGYGEKERSAAENARPEFIAADILEAAGWIIAR